MKLEYIVKSTEYKTVKDVTEKHFHISNRLLIKLKKNNQIYLNNTISRTDKSIEIGDTITINLSFPEKSENIVPTNLKLDIIFEDDSMLILNKPAGIPIHPSMDHFKDSLSNGVQFYYQIQGIQAKIHPVNRLDKNTSGIVIFAKNEYIQECLSKQMNKNIFKKYYKAILVR